MRSLLFLALLLGLLAVGVELLTRREYPVPAKVSQSVHSRMVTPIDGSTDPWTALSVGARTRDASRMPPVTISP